MALHVGVAVKTCVPPEARVAVVGPTTTESRLTIVIFAAELCTVIPLSVAFTKRPTLPAELPAVKVTLAPVVVLKVPMAPFVRVHEYVISKGHTALHVGVAMKTCAPPDASAAVAGPTATEFKAMIPMMAAELCTVTPLSVAFTKSPTLPAELPAVKVTLAPVVALRVPKVPFVRVQV
jgi:hypothetical protein